MANIHRLIVFLFLSFLSFNSFALVSKSSLYSSSQSFNERCASSSPISTAICVIETMWGHQNASCSSYSPFNNDFVNVSCSSSLNSSFKVSLYILSGSCPANSSPSGSQCSCNQGYEEKNGNSCVLPEQPDPCKGLEDFCKKVKGHEFEWETQTKVNQDKTICYKPSSVLVGLGGGMKPRFPGCNRGCGLSGGAYGIVEYVGPDGKESKNYSGYGNATGATCNDPPKENEPKEEVNDVESNGKNECPKGYFPGKVTINGLENKTCIPPKSKENTFEREMIDNLDGTKTQKESTVKCENGVCTVTTSVTVYDKDGNELNRGETDRYLGEREFCRERPNTAVCDTGKEVKPNPGEKPGEDGDDWAGPGAQNPGGGGNVGGEEGEGEGGGKFEGSCKSGFKCEGDAVQCSIAKNQHEITCKFFEKAEPDALPDGTEKNSAQGLKDDAEVINVQTDLDYSGLGWGRSCPADQDIDLGKLGGSMTIPYSRLCSILSPMSDIGLAITALGLLVWLVSGKKEG